MMVSTSMCVHHMLQVLSAHFLHDCYLRSIQFDNLGNKSPSTSSKETFESPAQALSMVKKSFQQGWEGEVENPQGLPCCP